MVAEDVMKAVEALAEIVGDMANRIASPFPLEFLPNLSERVDDLRKGCEALRAGKRGAPEAQRILDRQISTL